MAPEFRRYETVGSLLIDNELVDALWREFPKHTIQKSEFARVIRIWAGIAGALRDDGSTRLPGKTRDELKDIAQRTTALSNAINELSGEASAGLTMALAYAAKEAPPDWSVMESIRDSLSVLATSAKSRASEFGGLVRPGPHEKSELAKKKRQYWVELAVIWRKVTGQARHGKRFCDFGVYALGAAIGDDEALIDSERYAKDAAQRVHRDPDNHRLSYLE